jgi:hypothetical protein
MTTTTSSKPCLLRHSVRQAAGWNLPWLTIPGGAGSGSRLRTPLRSSRLFPLILLAAAEGLFVGGLSGILERLYPGVVVQAVLATLCVFAVTLALFASGKIRASKRATKIFLIALIGYGVFSLVNFFLIVFNVTGDPWGLRGTDIFGIPLGIVLGVFATLLATRSCSTSTYSARRRAGALRKTSWFAFASPSPSSGFLRRAAPDVRHFPTKGHRPVGPKPRPYIYFLNA